jgi:uncharacterized protein YoaH (UPF0181 family)
MSTYYSSACQVAEERIKGLMAQGLTRGQAAARVFKEDPDLRERMIAEANRGRTPPRRAA